MAVLAAAVLWAAAGCGGGSDDNTASSPAAGTTQAAPSKPPVDKAADQRIADAGKLRLTDFPSGFEQSDKNDDSATGTCDSIKDAKKATNRHDDAPSFSKGENTQATNVVYVYADEAGAQSAFQALSSRDTRVCVGKGLAEFFAKETRSKGPGDTVEVTVGKPTTGQVAVDAVGDEQAGGRATVPLNTQGLDVDVDVDLVFVRVGRAVTTLVFIDVLSPFDEDLRAQLTRKVVGRMTAATT